MRYEGGRAYYEAIKLSNEISSYPIEAQLLYLEKLLNKNFVLQDNWPHEIPDVTSKFKSWISQTITKLKVQQLSRATLDKNETDANVSTRKKRKNIPEKTRATLQREIGSSCPFCQGTDVGHFDVHHIDEIPDNNDISNLLMLCKICHSKITKGDIHKAEVIAVKKKLC